MGDPRFQATIQALLAAGLQLQRVSGTGLALSANVNEVERPENVYVDGEDTSFAVVNDKEQPDAGTSTAMLAEQQHQPTNIRHLSGSISSTDVMQIAAGPSSSSSHDDGESHPAYRMHIVPHNFYGPCKVCNADATGLHYGVATCEGCKGFFKRSLETDRVHPCASGTDNCEITSRTRNACRACRLKKCREVGMEWKLHRKRFRMKNLIHQRASAADLPSSAHHHNQSVSSALEQNRSIAAANNNMFAVPTSSITKLAPRRTVSAQSGLAHNNNAAVSQAAPTLVRTVYANDSDISRRNSNSSTQQQQQQQSSDTAVITDALRGGSNNLNAVLSQDTINKLLKIIANSTRPQQQQQQQQSAAAAVASGMAHRPSPLEPRAEQKFHNNGNVVSAAVMLSNADAQQLQRQQLLQLVGQLTNSFSNNAASTAAVPAAESQYGEQTHHIHAVFQPSSTNGVLADVREAEMMRRRDNSTPVEITHEVRAPAEQQQHQERIELAGKNSGGDQCGAPNLSTKTKILPPSSRSYCSLPSSVNTGPSTSKSSPMLARQATSSRFSLSPSMLVCANSQQQHQQADNHENAVRDEQYKRVAALISEVHKNVGDDSGVNAADNVMARIQVATKPPVLKAAAISSPKTFSSLQSQAVMRELNETITRLLTKRKNSLPTIAVDPPSSSSAVSSNGSMNLSSTPSAQTSPIYSRRRRRNNSIYRDKKLPNFNEILAAVRQAKQYPTIGNVCDYWCEQIWPTVVRPAAEAAVNTASTDAAASPVKRMKLSPTPTHSGLLKHRILHEAAEFHMPPSHNGVASSPSRTHWHGARSPPRPLLDDDVPQANLDEDDFLESPTKTSSSSVSEFSFDTAAIACAASHQSIKLRMRELADYARRHNSLSLALHVRNFLRPNIGILNSCARQLDDGFAECWLLRFERGRTKSLQRRTRNVSYQPETTIERFYEYINAFVLALLRVQCKFAELYIPGFWNLSAAVRAFCVTANYSAMYLAVFGPVISIEGRGTCINLSDLEFDSALGGHAAEPKKNGESRTSPPFAAAEPECIRKPEEELIASDYWLRYHMPEPVLQFYRTTASFIRELELPNILTAAFAATVFLRPLRMDRIPELVREEVAARVWRTSAASRSQWRRHEIELAEAHEYAYRLLHQLIVQHYGRKTVVDNDDEKQQRTARTVYNKIMFFLAVVSERLAVFDCKIFEATPLHFYDDGSFDWERLRHHVDSCCSPKLARWLNAPWLVAQRTDFARSNFNINEILCDVDSAATMLVPVGADDVE